MLTSESLKAAADDALRTGVAQLFDALCDRLVMIVDGGTADTAADARRAFARGLACLKDAHAIAFEEIDALRL